MKNRVWNIAALSAFVVLMTVCGCSGKGGGNRDVTKQKHAAKALAEREVQSRESSWDGVDSDVLETIKRPAGVEVVVHVWRIPEGPGKERYVTVFNNRVVRYDKRK